MNIGSSLASQEARLGKFVINYFSPEILKYISNGTYQELRAGYDRVIQMLSRLSQSLNR